jgi:HEAT repeat protein
MSGAQQFCPVCFRQIPLAVTHCPHCGAELDVLAARDFAERLIAALDHPLSEVRMRAIIALGWRSEKKAAKSLCALSLRHPVDVIEGLAVVESLAGMGMQGRVALKCLAQQHRAHAVRMAASHALVQALKN